MQSSRILCHAFLIAVILSLPACSTSWDAEDGGGLAVPRDSYGNPILKDSPAKTETSKTPPDK